MVNLQWIRCVGNVWCPLLRLNLETVTEHGVYVIWHAGPTPKVVYVGQGDVRARLEKHRDDQNIVRHEAQGELYVTWASVSEAERDGIERYLANTFWPIEGRRHPNVQGTPVNIPWA